MAASAAACGAYVSALVANLTFSGDPGLRLGWQAATIAITVVAFWLAWRGSAELAAGILLTGVWLELHVTIPFQGPDAAAMIALPVLVLAAGMLFGGKGGLAVAAASAAVLLVGSWSAYEVFGAPATDRRRTLYLVVISIAAAFVAAILVVAAIRAYGSAVARAVEGERRVAELVAFTPDGILALDAEQRVTAVNPAGERLLGRDRETLIGRPLRPHLEERVAPGSAEALDAALAGTPDHPIELAHGTGPSSWVEIAITDSPGIDGSGARHLTLRDVTARVLAEEQERLLQSQLEHTKRLDAVSRLAGGVAHDFNNVFTVIGGSAELLMQVDDDEVGSLAREILSAKNRGASLTRKMLAFARREVIQPRLQHFGPLLTQMRSLLSRLVGDEIQLVADVTDAPPVLADPAQVEQILISLVTNARDAIEGEGTVTLGLAGPGSPRAWPHSLLEDVPAGYVELWVEDDGRGMSPQTRARVFEPFFTTKGPAGGVGLGLASVHGIVTQNGGRVELESEEGRGTLVRVFWPLERPA